MMNKYKAVERILDDVTSRRGWSQEWDMFRDSIREEIKQTWYDILTEVENESETPVQAPSVPRSWVNY